MAALTESPPHARKALEAAEAAPAQSAALRKLMPHCAVGDLAGRMRHHFLLSNAAAAEAATEAAPPPTFDEAADLKKKQEDLARKASEAAEVEEERVRKMQELEASGKKAAGGLHKFDASEVDVNGGNATADDFMDAFGFGEAPPSSLLHLPGAENELSVSGEAEEAAP